MGQADEATTAQLINLVVDLLITELGRSGVPQSEIRRIVGCDINRVSRIVKHMKRRKTRNAE